MKYIQTNNLTVIDYGDGGAKLQIYNKHKSPYGWSPRSLIVSLPLLVEEASLVKYTTSVPCDQLLLSEKANLQRSVVPINSLR